jgi:hypothetical protein
VAMKVLLEIREHQSLQTHLSLTSDFTGSLMRILTTTSLGRKSDISFASSSFFERSNPLVLAQN